MRASGGAVVLLAFVATAAAQGAGPGRGGPPRGYFGRQGPHPCEKSSCYPATGNLMIGREDKLTASSTCGTRSRERYCIVSHLEDRKKCFWCDTRPQTENDPMVNHRVANIVYRYQPGTRKRSWWQSSNGVENVTLRLDLEAEFHFTHLVIVFKTFRPAAMLIERSFDFGKTWRVYRYFARDCAEAFPNVPARAPKNLTEVVCDSKYSNVAPSTDGEIIFRVLTQGIRIDNPYSQEVQNLLKMTNLRLNFTRLHTLGDDLLDDRAEIREKYYYAINDMTVRGSCSCYGHASRCLPLPGVEAKTDMVYGRCECTHNTKGLNCELCEDFYNDLPWKPAIGKTTNACQRCNCNNHATSCHFDPAVYESTGKFSGGVCDDCQHNTMGRNCELCKTYYYRDTELHLEDPEVCKPCDCDPRGSLDDAVCDPLTDQLNGLESGRCHCKKNVVGRRCDSCKSGHWNFNETDPEGCKACACNPLGTVDDRGCDVNTGECTCKRNVEGRDCNLCLAEHWGLSEDEDGCRRCDCDYGGSLDNNCDVITGQCNCRPGVQGRRCDKPDQNHFSPSVDVFTYEAETADCNLGDANAISGNCIPDIREPFRDGREDTWTGPGFMKVFEGELLTFTVDDIRAGMDYDIVIRYDTSGPADWQRAVVEIERPGPIDPDSPCGNYQPTDDTKEVYFPHNQRSVVVTPPTCFEAGKVYKIRIDFERQNIATSNPTASVLIDSIVLKPRVSSIPLFGKDDTAAEIWRRNYELAGCDDALDDVSDRRRTEECKKYYTTIGFYVTKGSIFCDCDPTGSISHNCEEYGGKCPCKPNVVGRKCNRCSPGTFGFGPEGCKACDCSNIGSLDNFCDVGTGRCKCRPNTYGRQCDQCQPGYWNFPNCQKCECHGHADACDSRTGACISCRNFTEGHRCERCLDGYYGDPRIGVDIPCRSCPCPGSRESQHSFAPRCLLDKTTKDVLCECLDGYAGTRCDVCADNYYGHPEIPGGSCEKCNCNKNIDVSTPGNCDPHTGKCLKCLYETAGDNCERCREGFYGDASAKTCRECDCEILGTNTTVGPCDGITGQCACFPNVIGQRCDQCIANHWKLASGEGCVACDCDPNGSLYEQCNVFDGACDCKPGFGGRQCDQCQTNYWGDPNEKCQPCVCDDYGTAQKQCKHDTGACVCKQGKGGYHCDTCARGFYGDECEACGECFDNWDNIVSGLYNKTNEAIEKASKIQTIGATGAYAKDFDEIEGKLEKIQKVVDETASGTERFDNFTDAVDKVKDSYKIVDENVSNLKAELLDVTNKVNFAKYNIEDLRENYNVLIAKTAELDNNATKLQEANLEGALNLTRDAKKKAMDVADDAEATQTVLAEAERFITATEQLVERYDAFNTTQKENDKKILDLEETLADLESQIPELNDKMCGPGGDSCSLCGGAGCGKCGGFSCDRAAVTKASQALDYANKTNIKIQGHEADADGLLRAITIAKRNTSDALESARNVHRLASDMRNRTDDLTNATNKVIDELKDFLTKSEDTPNAVKTLADKILNTTIDLNYDDVSALAVNISETASRVTDIDRIIQETAQDLEDAKKLKNRALRVKEEAVTKWNKTNAIIDALNEAATAQKLAEEEIKKATEDVDAVKQMPSIDLMLQEANRSADQASAHLDDLSARLKTLEITVLKEEESGEKIKNLTDSVVIKAENAQQQAQQLRKSYANANETLVNRIDESATSRIRAESLLQRATQLAADTRNQLQKLQTMEDLYNSHNSRFKELDDQIGKLNDEVKFYLKKIIERNSYYSSCLT